MERIVDGMKLHCILRRFFIPYNLPGLFQGCEKLEKSPLPLRISFILLGPLQHDIIFTVFWRQCKVNRMKQKQRSLGGGGALCFFSGTAGARRGGGGGRKPRS
jgi:hypothetical protein